MPGVPTLALTATAITRVQKDILRLLKIKQCKQFQVPAWWHARLQLPSRC